MHTYHVENHHLNLKQLLLFSKRLKNIKQILLQIFKNHKTLKESYN